MEIATWVIAIFTIILTIATIAYAWISYLSYNASNKQSEALNELSKAIREIGPSIIANQSMKEIQRELAEKAKKNNPQRRALGLR
jgi:CHASE3 domain sensor protein